MYSTKSLLHSGDKLLFKALDEFRVITKWVHSIIYWHIVGFEEAVSHLAIIMLFSQRKSWAAPRPTGSSLKVQLALPDALPGACPAVVPYIQNFSRYSVKTNMGLNVIYQVHILKMNMLYFLQLRNNVTTQNN